MTGWSATAASTTAGPRNTNAMTIRTVNRPRSRARKTVSADMANLQSVVDSHETSFVPQASDVALLVNPKGTLAERQIKDGTTAAATLGQRLHVINTSTVNDIDAAFETMVQSKIGAFIVSTDPFFGFIGRDRLVNLARRYKIPGIYNAREESGIGGLVSYGPNLPDTWRQAAVYVGRILKGEKPRSKSS